MPQWRPQQRRLPLPPQQSHGPAPVPADGFSTVEQAVADLRAKNLAGIILSGGPFAVYEDGAPHVAPGFWDFVEERIDAFFKSSDLDGDGGISEVEFVHFIEAHAAHDADEAGEVTTVGTHAVVAPARRCAPFAATIACIASGQAHMPFPICARPRSPARWAHATFHFS